MEPWRRIDTASVDEARALLTTCCGSSRWVDRMLAQRPFASRIGLLTAAREEWNLRFERAYVQAVLAEHEGNVTEAARAAEVDRAYFYRLLWKHRLR